MSFKFAEQELGHPYNVCKTKFLETAWYSGPDEQTINTAREFLSPATAFMLDLTLSTLEQPDVLEKLPHEVARRSTIAAHLATNIAELFTKQGALVALYNEKPKLRNAMDSGRLEMLIDFDVMGPLVVDPFVDPAVVIGGGVRAVHQFPKKREVPDCWRNNTLNAKDIIIRSGRSLSLIGSLPDKEVKPFLARLGQPYAKVGSFDPIETDGLPALRFTNETLRLMGNLMTKGSGCPARTLQDPESLAPITEFSFFDATWVRTANLFLDSGGMASYHKNRKRH